MSDQTNQVVQPLVEQTRQLRLKPLVCVLISIFCIPALAQVPPRGQSPTGGVVTAGQANINQSGNVTTVNQATNRASIKWNSFDVGKDATVNFVQPDSKSVILNRVDSMSPSQIYGQINANGQVYLMNPAGIYFAPSASVNVGGIVATTHQMSDEDFMNGKTTFSRRGAKGSVVNEGKIESDIGGYVALLAPEVRNKGFIIARQGVVAMAGGESITLNFGPLNKLESVTVTAGDLTALIDNQQAVQAPGGLVIMSAKAINQLASRVVNTGVIEAQGLSDKGGRIVLDAGATGITVVSGVLDVSSQEARGGRVDVTGQNVQVRKGGRIQASGATGGGEVFVGGGWQGKDPSLLQATNTTIESGAVVQANATQKGSGGTVVAWSDTKNIKSSTVIKGVIEAKGGPKGGNGGQIETSGAQVDIAGAQISAQALKGQGGVWLIDPYDYVIGVAQASTIANSLNAGTSVVVDTFVNNSALGSNGNISSAGNITITSSIIKSTGGTATLTLNAANDIFILAGISSVASGLDLVLNSASHSGVVSGQLGLGSGSLTKQGAGTIKLTANNTYRGVTTISAGSLIFENDAPSMMTSGFGGAGVLAIQPASTSFSGTYTVPTVFSAGSLGGLTIGKPGNTASINIPAGSDINVAGSLAIYGGSISVWSNLSTTVAGGNIQLIADTGRQLNYAGSGVYINANITTLNGDIDIQGRGGNTASSNIGVEIESGKPIIAGGRGAVSISGIGGTSTNGGNNNDGIVMFGGSFIYTSSGSLSLRGVEGSGSISEGIATSGPKVTIGQASQTGAITFNADSIYTTGLNIRGSGSMTVAPLSTSASFSSAISFSDFNFDSSLGGLTIGKATNTAPLSFSKDVAVNGPISLYGGSVSLSANVSASSGDIFVSSAGTATIASGKSLSTTNGNIVVSATQFVNNGSASVFKVSGTSKTWQVWSTNASPFSGGTADVTGGLAFDYVQYAANYGVTAVAGQGNGLLYSLAPTIGVALTGNATKVYDGGTSASLTSANYKLIGSGVNGDVVVPVNNPVSGSYASQNAGTGILVSASGASRLSASTSAASGSKPVYGYTLTGGPAIGNIGVITPANLTITTNDLAQPFTGVAFYGGNGIKATGFVSGETTSVLAGTLTYLGTSQGAINPGAYSLVASGLTNANYKIGYVGGILAIAQPVFGIASPAPSSVLVAMAPSPSTLVIPAVSNSSNTAEAESDDGQFLDSTAGSKSRDGQAVNKSTEVTLRASQGSGANVGGDANTQAGTGQGAGGPGDGAGPGQGAGQGIGQSGIKGSDSTSVIASEPNSNVVSGANTGSVANTQAGTGQGAGGPGDGAGPGQGAGQGIGVPGSGKSTIDSSSTTSGTTSGGTSGTTSGGTSGTSSGDTSGTTPGTTSGGTSSGTSGTTSGGTSGTSSGATSGTTSDATSGGTPSTTSGETSSGTSGTTSGGTSGTSSGATSGTTSGGTPSTTSGETSSGTSGTTSGGTSGTSSGATSGTTSDATSGGTPGATSGGTSSGTSGTTSGGTSGTSSGATSGTTSDATSGGTPGATSGGTSGTTSGGTSGTSSGATSGTTSGETSSGTSGTTSGGTSGISSGATSGTTSGGTSGGTSGTTSGETSGTTSGTTSGGTSGGTPGTTSGGTSGTTSSGTSSTTSSGTSATSLNALGDIRGVAAEGQRLVTYEDISVSLVREAKPQLSGLVTVLVPKSIIASGEEFSFKLPEKMSDVAINSKNILVTTESGGPLPSWLQFDSSSKTLVSSSSADRVFPLKLVVRINNQTADLIISERTNQN